MRRPYGPGGFYICISDPAGVRSPLNLLGRFSFLGIGLSSVLDLVALRPAIWNTSTRTRASREYTRSLQRSDKATGEDLSDLLSCATVLHKRPPPVAMDEC